MEWEWLNYVMECFNFGMIFREWVYMLFKRGKTCIKTNGFISKFFAISRSARQGCPAAPILYIIQAEPMDGLCYPKHSGNTWYQTTRLRGSP